jgi:hypothetical protein
LPDSLFCVTGRTNIAGGDPGIDPRGGRYHQGHRWHHRPYVGDRDFGRAAVEQQGKATAEIAHNIQQAAAGTQEVSAHIVGVTAAASESGKTAADVLGSTARLTAESEALGGEVDRFLNRIKAA